MSCGSVWLERRQEEDRKKEIRLRGVFLRHREYLDSLMYDTEQKECRIRREVGSDSLVKFSHVDGQYIYISKI